MDKCPPEIHSRILYFACLDNGTTGRALSLVSRYIREVSLPYQWLSLRLVGARNLELFLQQCTDFEILRRPIYHLFLGEGSDDPYEPYSRVPDSPDPEIGHQLDFGILSWRFLCYAAPTLQTLTFFSSAHGDASAQTIAYILQVQYPNLSEMTIRSRCIPFQILNSLQTPLNTPPNLRRLHLALPCHGFAHDNFGGLRYLIEVVGPSITHLRITMLDRWGSKRVAEVIHAELHSLGLVDQVIDISPVPDDVSPTVTAPEITWPRLLPESLQSFVLQPSPTLNFYCSCCMELRSDVNVMRLLEKLSETSQDDFFTMIPQRSNNPRLFPRFPIHDTVYSLEEAVEDWSGRIRDLAGCWERRARAGDESLSVDEVPFATNRLLDVSNPSWKQAEAKRTLFVTRSVRKFFVKLKQSVHRYMLTSGLRSSR